MSEINVQAVQSQSLNAPVRFEDSAGTEIGRLCLASVNFNGTGTVAIRASFNVLGITDNGAGDYTVNFSNALPDANYSLAGSAAVGGTATPAQNPLAVVPYRTTTVDGFSASSIRILTADNDTNTAIDAEKVSVSIFR